MARKLTLIVLLLSATVLLPLPARADCPGPLVNPGFEEGGYKTEILGTSLSSNLGNGWKPWSILGDATYNREVEYKVLDAASLGSNYHIHSGNHSQKFFTTWGTHTAGFYQRVQVPRGSRVTFSIWVQIYTGERELVSGDHFISDLEQPAPGDSGKGPGLYRVCAGIDPYGDEPPGFGAPPSANTIWSDPVTDFETRVVTESGEQIDAWVKLTVSAVAQRDVITVYTKGQPEYPVKHNDSFWDDACLIVQLPPTPTPRPTSTPTATPMPTDTPVPTDTPLPTETPQPTETPTVTPTDTPVPSDTPAPTDTPEPTVTTVPTETAQPTVAATDTPQPTVAAPAETQTNVPATTSGTGLTFVYGGVAALAVAAIVWLRIRKH